MSNTDTMMNNHAVLEALQSHQVTAEVVDLDHYRIGGGLAVETDYIIVVKHKPPPHAAASVTSGSSLVTNDDDTVMFDPFTLSKSYSAFRTLAAQLKNAADQYMAMNTTDTTSAKSNSVGLPREAITCAKYCELVSHLIESQKTQYLGKVNYLYVKALSKQRSRILNDALDAICSYFPEKKSRSTMEKDAAVPPPPSTPASTPSRKKKISMLKPPASPKPTPTPEPSAPLPPSMQKEQAQHPLLAEVGRLIETFFLTDHIAFDLINDSSKFNLSEPSSSTFAFGIPNLVGRKLGLTSGSNHNHHLDKTGTTTTSATTKDATATKSSVTSSTSSNRKSIIVQPMTRKERPSDEMREQEDRELSKVGDEAKLIFVDDKHANDGDFIGDDDADAAVDLQPEQQSHERPSSPNVATTTLAQQQQTKKVFPRKKTAATSSGGLRASLKASPLGIWYTSSPTIFSGIVGLVLYLIHVARAQVVSIDGDVAILTLFAAFCLGLHTSPKPIQSDTSKKTASLVHFAPRSSVVSSRRSSLRSTMSARGTARAMSNRILLQRMSVRTGGFDLLEGGVTEDALLAADEEELDDEEPLILGSPLPMFPPGAKIGSHNNCWSEPDPGNFYVRGPKYLTDKKKIASEEFLFPTRGIDLFLTDTCPANVGANSSMFGGNLRDEPTFIINFRLPWGVLVFYFCIPDMFLPYLKAGHDPVASADEKTKGKLLASMKKMSAGERAACRWLMGSAEYKNSTLKIVPVVVDGPWVVRQVVGGKPAIIGTKLEVSYVYQPAEENETKKLYLEADLDIAASSAARGILSVAKSYTQVLTLDLGFVVQGNQEDELPERMLVGTRIHGVDPLSAPDLPPMVTMFDNMFNDVTNREEDDLGSVAAVTPNTMARE